MRMDYSTNKAERKKRQVTGVNQIVYLGSEQAVVFNMSVQEKYSDLIAPGFNLYQTNKCVWRTR